MCYCLEMRYTVMWLLKSDKLYISLHMQYRLISLPVVKFIFLSLSLLCYLLLLFIVTYWWINLDEDI